MIHYRRATIADLDTITHHRRAMFSAMGQDDPQALQQMSEQFQTWATPLIESDEFITWFACDNQQIIGGGGLMLSPYAPSPTAPHQTTKGHIYNVFVEDAYRGSGHRAKIDGSFA